MQARDGVCDEGRAPVRPRRAAAHEAAQRAAGLPPGVVAVHCDLGTDCADCGPWAGRQADEHWCGMLPPVPTMRHAASPKP